MTNNPFKVIFFFGNEVNKKWSDYNIHLNKNIF